MQKTDNMIFVFFTDRIAGHAFTESDFDVSVKESLRYRQIISVRGTMISLA